MNKIKITKKEIFSLVAAVLLTLAHIAIILLSTYVFRYYNIYPKLFLYIYIVIICFFIIVDIVFFIGLKHADLIQKSIVCVLSIMILIGGCYGTFIMSETNKLVDNVVQVGDEDRYETINGLFVSYKNDKFNSYNSVEEMKAAGEFKLGTLAETSEDSITAAGIQKLEDKGVTNYIKKAYANNTDLLFALINEEVDVAVFSSMYQAIFKADENVDYTQYLTEVHEIDDFSKDILVSSNASKKDLSKDPFNVLLIGWSPVIGSTTIGLADAIIVASVNPQTYTVSMMSLARDSYVPIACYGGESDKINSGRGTSMDCFVKTVEDLIDDEIDFYMEVDFTAFADLCGHFGGIEIDNPVSFELDGVYVPAGHYIADGWQALQFARERHHMPNGDFDRQQHQKEVIMKLAEQFLNHSLADALEIFNFISGRLNTNMTLSQLTGMFNMLTSTKNYTGLSLFNLLDMHALRVTGYADWHYNDDYELPLWIYRLYQGSIDESLAHMQEVLGNYKTIEQDYGFAFSVNEPYVRAPFYSLDYNEEEFHEKLPPYYINLTSMTYDEAMAWAAENGATLVATFIRSGEEGYDEALDGKVISQSVAYGKKISKYPTCNITVMGGGVRKINIPDYAGWDLDRAKLWVADNNIESGDIKVKYNVYYISSDDKDHANKEIKSISQEEEKIYITYYEKCAGKATDGVCDLAAAENFKGKTESELKTTYSSTYSKADRSFTYNGFTYKFVDIETEDTTKVGKVIEQSTDGTTVTLKVGKAKSPAPMGTCVIGEKGVTACNADNTKATSCAGTHELQSDGTCKLKETQPTPTCPEHATCELNDGNVTSCDEGYEKDGNSCKLKETQPTPTCPEHAICELNDGNVTSCNEGYEKDGNSCKLKETQTDPPPETEQS